MAKQRIIAPTATDSKEEQSNLSLRPTQLNDYVGQSKLIEKLKITLEAVKQRSEPMEHVLLHGPPRSGQNHTRPHHRQRDEHTHDLNFWPSTCSPHRLGWNTH